MPKQSEALVLRTYPFQEADLLVTLFTRSEGKIKGVARHAKRSRRRFGGALEPLTHVVAHWQDKEKQELARLDSCDILASPLTSEVSYSRAVALSYVAEVIDQLLPEREPHDDVFRLALSVVRQLAHASIHSPVPKPGASGTPIHPTAPKPGASGAPIHPTAPKPGASGTPIWMPLTYFDLWLVRLIGLLPDLHACVVCGATLNGSKAWFHPLADGLLCVSDKRLASSEISADSRALAAEMFRAPIENFSALPWPRQRAADLRKFLAQRIERHIERKLVTGAMLERVE